jgi:hypothetical protein
LSAHLASFGNATEAYLPAALLAAQFIELQLTDPSSLVYDSIKLDTCTGNLNYAPQNTGAMIEGMAVLANVTGNATWLDRYAASVLFAVCHVLITITAL